mmetsp:Transcript_12826/g.18661  ORF Transcript_12826/g.18661 Transcript_12826/m.18661 type:complete len:158 (-) Transcript_12826:72-545(-)
MLPISGWMGDNLLKKSTNMAWWSGVDVEVGKETLHIDTLYDVLDKMCKIPERPVSAPMRMPISGIYKIKGVGDVLAGRVEQSILFTPMQICFTPNKLMRRECCLVWPWISPALWLPLAIAVVKLPSAGTMMSATSAWEAPVIMFLMKSLWPGASMMV